MRNPLCIYHSNCADGFAAAWVVRRALGDGVEFHAGTYGNPPPADIAGRDIVIVDFSYKRPVLDDMIQRAASVIILDHHKSAQEDMDGITGATAVFDMQRSGARIAWDHYFPNEAPPALLLHIEDRDLWRFAMPGTREIQANVFSHSYDFDVWDILMAADPIGLAADGVAIERKHHKDIAELLNVVVRPMCIGGHVIDVANVPYQFTSDAGHQLAIGKPFGACYWDTPQGRVFSLRSTDAGLDVSAIASLYGGGGHHNAAGFRISFADAQMFEIP